MRKPNLKVFRTGLLLILEVCNVKATNRKSWVGNLFMWSDLTLHLSFKVKRRQLTLKMLITSGIFSLYIFYYCFYRFAMFGDTPPARNKVSGISLVFLASGRRRGEIDAFIFKGYSHSKGWSYHAFLAKLTSEDSSLFFSD